MQRAASFHSPTDETPGVDGRGGLLSDRGCTGAGPGEDARPDTGGPGCDAANAIAGLCRHREYPPGAVAAERVLYREPAQRKSTDVHESSGYCARRFAVDSARQP